MPAETCLKLPPNFPAREEVRRLVMALERRELEANHGLLFAFMLWVEWAAQGKEWRPLTNPPAASDGLIDWNVEELSHVIAHGAGWGLKPGVLIEAALEAGFMKLDRRNDLAGLALTDFANWNEHLLPGYQNFWQKGQQKSVEARHRTIDPTLARQQRTLLEQGALNLGELSADITKTEIEEAIALVMQLDRASGMAMRATAGYGTWMLAAANRLLREKEPKAIERLLQFVFEARQDPTVPKGAELILQHVDKVLERSVL